MKKTFAELYVEGVYSNAECARKAGFSHDVAHIYSAKLLNGNDFPHVVEYIKELREAKERRYGVTTIPEIRCDRAVAGTLVWPESIPILPPLRHRPMTF